MKDYPEEEDTEEVVLSRWGKIKQWIEIVMATKKIAMLLWGLLVTSGGALVVGQATDTKPIRDAAVAMGILDERPATDDIPDVVFDELQNLMVDIEQGMVTITEMQAEIRNHQHDFAIPEYDGAEKDHSHDFPVPTAPSEASHDHNGLAPTTHTHIEAPTHTHALTASETVSAKAINDALLKHIKGDH